MYNMYVALNWICRILQITELAGYTQRVSEMLRVFEEVQQGQYQVTHVSEDQQEKSGKSPIMEMDSLTYSPSEQPITLSSILLWIAYV